ncbi:hypothetical protein [Luteolibacter sp. Populi]|uniref:hypothetical protein n=1 Tax=Luteolibacter sp. Populi TaxID=3230487 RepID=UPI0034674CFB
MNQDTSAQEGGAAALECGGHRRFRALQIGDRRIEFASTPPPVIPLELRIFPKVKEQLAGLQKGETKGWIHDGVLRHPPQRGTPIHMERFLEELQQNLTETHEKDAVLVSRGTPGHFAVRATAHR